MPIVVGWRGHPTTSFLVYTAESGERWE